MNDAYLKAARILDALGTPAAAHGLAFLERVSKPWAARARLAPSLLTPDGSPIELAFSTSSRELRVTVEPSLPDDTPRAKWRAASAFVADAPLLRTLRRARDQRFGCWLAAHCSAEGASMKVYQEVAPSMRARMGDLLLVGASDDGTLEHYGALIAPQPRTIHALFAAAGLPEHSPAVTRTLASLAAREPRRVFEEMKLGVSLRPGAITLFAPARQLFLEDDAVARRRILSTAHQLGYGFAAYESATRTLSGMRAHAMAGITATATGLHLWAGLQPFGSSS